LTEHGVVIEGNRKMTGCLQTFGGHCILSTSPDLVVLFTTYIHASLLSQNCKFVYIKAYTIKSLLLIEGHTLVAHKTTKGTL